MSVPFVGGRRVPNWRLVVPSILVLAVCLFYTGAAMYLAPYPGVEWGADWVVTAIEPCEVDPIGCMATQDSLQVGDQMLIIGNLTYDEYLDDKSKIIFGGYAPGENVPITLLRDEEELVVEWRMLGPADATRARRLIESLPLYMPFWLAGTMILLLLRPRDLRWWLLIGFNYVTALWLAIGAHSARGVAFASPLQHALAWLFALVCLHLHLIVPTPLLGRRRYVWLAYGLILLLAVLEIFRVFPDTAYLLGLLLAFSGSVGLLIFRLLARNSQDKLAARLMLIGIGMAFGPAVVLWIVPAFLMVPLPTGVTLYMIMFATPLLPFFYLYAIYKRRLSTLEFRANRLLGTYAFFLLYAILFLLVLLVGGEWLGDLAGSVGFPLLVSAVFVLAAVPLRARFQQGFDRLAYGARYNPAEVARVFSGRIATALDHDKLADLLAGEVAPSLLVRQSALVLLAGEEGVECVYARGLDEDGIPRTSQQVEELLDVAGRYRPPLLEPQDGFDWVRLAVPLVLRKITVGAWLFGRRDPDDYYPQADVDLLHALAGQVAVTVENTRLYADQRRRAEEASLLLGIANAISSTLERDSILKEMTVRAARACQAHRCTLFLLENDEFLDPVISQLAFGELDPELWRLFTETRSGWRVDEVPEIARVVRERQPLLVPDAAASAFPRHWIEPFDAGGVLIIPLISREQVTGLMLLDYPEVGRTLTKAQMNLAMAIGGQAAVAIENTRLHQELEDYTRHLEQRVQERLYELETQYAWLEAILHGSSDGIIVSDVQGEILQTNPMAEAWLTQTLSPEDAARLRAKVCELAGRAEERPEAMLELSGLDLELVASPVLEPGRGQAGVVVAVHDITHLKALDRMKSRFVSDVSHELRTPITTIKLYTALMRKASPERMKQYLDMLAEESERQVELVEDILQISRIDAGRLEMARQVVSLNDLSREVIERHQDTARERGLIFEHRLVTPDLIVMADPDRLLQVLSNLVMNAISYTASGGSVVLSTAREEMNGAAWATATIADTGMGIPGEEMARIFDRFYRGERSRLSHMPGTGLGLALVKEIVELHGGRVTVESEMGEGSAFTIWLPLV